MTPVVVADMPGFAVKVLGVFAIKMFVFDINKDNLYLSPPAKANRALESQNQRVITG